MSFYIHKSKIWVFLALFTLIYQGTHSMFRGNSFYLDKEAEENLVSNIRLLVSKEQSEDEENESLEDKTRKRKQFMQPSLFGGRPSMFGDMLPSMLGGGNMGHPQVHPSMQHILQQSMQQSMPQSIQNPMQAGYPHPARQWQQFNPQSYGGGGGGGFPMHMNQGIDSNAAFLHSSRPSQHNNIAPSSNRFSFAPSVSQRTEKTWSTSWTPTTVYPEKKFLSSSEPTTSYSPPTVTVTPEERDLSPRSVSSDKDFNKEEKVVSKRGEDISWEEPSRTKKLIQEKKSQLIKKIKSSLDELPRDEIHSREETENPKLSLVDNDEEEFRQWKRHKENKERIEFERWKKARNKKKANKEETRGSPRKEQVSAKSSQRQHYRRSSEEENLIKSNIKSNIRYKKRLKKRPNLNTNVDSNGI